ncbi:PREDICTED: nascent polypeptide-associated complex subunit alpha, muscle-specific form-like isoform X2 [Dufourea novaeangliae]|uniref:nascent polypeptide-associated complex subunit alpha, muscle-specific form-like isoform X2 n=1 Tax=Dufourea novaeangliae TaxID=178035 RepID=UPI00076743A9|nr:PREDICTED: nascent polypeptide-associated complex subunit alpha, muscle-specific form-like isoform X2 [Dufourea novaeangliae]
MPYYGESLPYYYGGAFANHSSLMTGTPRSFHTPLSRFSPHLSTISESPLSTLRRYSPVTVPTRPRRVIDTADIDVSTPRISSGDGTHQRNRLRRDRPTIKIRSQALKDNPALREHNERHEKSVGELLVEKFLIKDKKLDEAEKGLQLFHQVSLARDEAVQEQEQQQQQQDPQQLEREVAYAQVQAKVLDTLVAEEQAEIENEVRRGTLIKKGTIGGHKSVPGFFRTVDSVSQVEEEDSTAQKMRKSLKKVKKKKRGTEKPPDNDNENERERRSSTSSDVSVDLQSNEENRERKLSRPQAYKIEASNSVGDFSTVWVTAEPSISIEQFRESVKIPVPRKINVHKTDSADESETEVVLPVKRPYVKDTSRNSVHYTVRTPTENLRNDPMKSLKTVRNGVTVEKMEDKPESSVTKDASKDTVPEPTMEPKSPELKQIKTELPSSPKSKTPSKLKLDQPESPIYKDPPKYRIPEGTKEAKSPEVKQTKTELPSSPKSKTPSKLKLDQPESPVYKDPPKYRIPEGTKEAKSPEVKQTKTELPSSPKSKTPSKLKLDQPESPVYKDPPKYRIPEGTKEAKSPEVKQTKTELPSSPKSKTPSKVKQDKPESPVAKETPKNRVPEEKSPEVKQTQTERDKSVPSSPKSPSTPKKEDTRDVPKLTKKDAPDKEVTESTTAPTMKKEEAAAAQKRPELSRPRKLGVSAPEESSPKTSVPSNGVTLAVDPFTSENSANVTTTTLVRLPLAGDGLPKQSKITTDENNAVEAPKQALREPEYLANTTKTERDGDDVGSPLPGNRANKAVTLTAASASHNDVTGEPGNRGITEENRSGKSPLDDATATTKKVTKSTLFTGPKCDTQTKEDIEKTSEDVKGKKGLSAVKNNDGFRLPFKIAKKTDTDKGEEKVLKNEEATPGKESKIPWRNKVSNSSTESGPRPNRSISVDSKANALKQTTSVDEARKMPVDKQQSVKMFEGLNGESGTLSKSTSTESIDFWSEIKGPESPQVAKVAKGFNFVGSKTLESRQSVEDPGEKEMDKKKDWDPKISVAGSLVLSNISVIEEEQKAEEESCKSTAEEKMSSIESPRKAPKKKRNLSIAINQTPKDATVKRTPLSREDSTASTISARSVGSTPDTSVPASEVSTPVFDVSLPLINIVAATTPIRTDSEFLEEDEDQKTPTNEWPGSLHRISKWTNQSDLSNVDDTEKDVTPVPSKTVSVAATPEGSPESSKKKKVVRKKKSSTTKKNSSSKKDSKKETKESKKSSTKSQDSLKPPESKTSSKTAAKSAPTPKPIDLIRMFYTTPTALLTATPRDLSKVRRAKIKRRKHHSRTPSVSSDSTGSTTSTATTESSGSTCTELDDDPDKRMNSTRSNDSGFDGSPRISTPSQSSDTQRNSDSSDHFPSGRITPPATNLPRFKKYAVTDFNFLKVLGKGSFGKVLLAELRGTECVYAVKCLKKDVVLEDDDVECTLIERKVLTLATRHPYLCHLFCTFQTDSHLFFVMEYLNGGDLMFHIQKSGRFSETRARFYAAEIWSGLNFLHKKGIVYRDLKLDNVLLDFEGHIRIADFGMCKLQIFLDRTADTFCGTPDYMAPEIIKGLKYNQAVDWWSYGVLLYEMLTGQSPFSGCDEDELFWSICNERPFIPRYLSQDATDMLVCLLEKDSGKRLPGHDIAYHAFFQSLPWDRLERRQLEPPFKPALEHTLDTKYFDTAFTAERPRLTPVPDQILTSMDQGVFRGFSYTNPNATD